MRGRLNTQDINDVVGGDSISDAINTGIGIIIPAQMILDFINQPAFVTQREETVKELKKKTHFRPSAATPSIGNKAITFPDNPQHKEDFNSLLFAALKKKPQADET
jgi:hypothetical protein